MKTKLFIVCLTCFLAFTSNIFGQKDCGKLAGMSKDEYTNEKIVGTEMMKIIKPNGKHLLNSIIDNNDNQTDWFVYLNFHFEKNFYVCLRHYSYESYSAVSVNKAYVKFTDETTIILEKGIELDLKQDGPNNSYRETFFEISANDLKNFRDKTIKKIKVIFINQPREPEVETEFNEKDASYLKNIASCFVQVGEFDLNNAKSEIVKNESSTENNNNDKQQNDENNNSSTQNDNNNEGNYIEIPKPTNDTTSVTLYKQWKLIANLDNDGIPKELKSTTIKQIFKDGTYKNYITFSNGNKLLDTGTIQLLNDNSIVVYTSKTGGSSSSKIMKLTKKELETKGGENHYFYIAY